MNDQPDFRIIEMGLDADDEALGVEEMHAIIYRGRTICVLASNDGIIATGLGTGPETMQRGYAKSNALRFLEKIRQQRMERGGLSPRGHAYARQS